MNIKENLEKRMAAVAKATPKPTTTHITSQTVKIQNVISGMLRVTDRKAAFKKEVINLAVTLKEKLQFLAAGKAVIIDHKEDAAIKLVDNINLQEIIFAAIGIAFDFGVARVIIEPLTKTNIQLRLADPHFPNVVRKMGRIPYEAEIWTVFKFERAKYWKRTIYRENEILNDIYSDVSGGGDFDNKKKVNIKEFNNKIQSDSLKVKPRMKNPFKFIPVVEVPYVPTNDLSTIGLHSLAPKKRLEGIQEMLNEGTAALRLERYLNRTKMLIDQDLLDTVSKEALQKIADENILGVVSDSGDHDGKNKVVEVLQGDPKLTEYWLDITNTISLAVQTLKLSELGESDSTTATDAIFNKGNDVETVNTLGTFWQRKISEILQKAFFISKGKSFTEAELDINDWGVQMVPNVIMNEAKMTDIVIAQLGAGLVNMVQAKVKLENISPSAARAQLDEEEEHFNPTLEAAASFGNEEEEEGKGDNSKPNKPKKKKADAETGNPQPKSTGAKK